MRILSTLLFLLSSITYGQCVNYADITTANYSQALTQSETYITISSSVYPLAVVKLDANPSNGYVLMNPGFIATPSGNNAFIAQALDGCDISIPSKTTSLEVKDIITKEINIYPNPTTEYLNISSNINILNYKICSLDGKEIIISNQLNNTKEQINVSVLAAGFYLINIETGSNEILSYKFIKK